MSTWPLEIEYYAVAKISQYGTEQTINMQLHGVWLQVGFSFTLYLIGIYKNSSNSYDPYIQ